MPEPPRWRRLDLEFPLAAGRGRRETSALRVALGSSRVPCGLCNSHRRGEGKRGRMLDGRPCLNFDCINGWRKRRAGDPWWDAYLEQRVDEPAKAPQRDYDLDGFEHGFLIGGGWHIEKAGTTGAPDGRPITGANRCRPHRGIREKPLGREVRGCPHRPTKARTRCRKTFKGPAGKRSE
jgi:hypothetical protein